MGKFKIMRGAYKFQYWRMAKPEKKYAWIEKNMKTGKKTKISWEKAKAIFSVAYDKKFAKRLAVRHNTTIAVQYEKIREYRKHGKDFGELY